MTVEVVKPGLIGNSWREPGEVLSMPDGCAKRLLNGGRVKKTDKHEHATLNHNLENPEQAKLTFKPYTGPVDAINVPSQPLKRK